MNNDLFQRAKAAVEAKDYHSALGLYTACLQDSSDPLGPGEIGLLYHRIGNCLTKLKNYEEAIQAYQQAAGDTAYDACGAVNYNMGMAYAALHDFDDAVKHFEIAVSDGKYLTPYKAYTAMGNALLKKGKSAEAGVAFREAALDETNPDPTKALLNLGVCFMALDRPADAVASYESALQFEMLPNVRNKMHASLGQAYVACGQMQKAVDAFEQSIADKTYFLSASASVDYQRAVAAVSQGAAEVTQVLPALPADTSGLDVVTTPTDAFSEADSYGQDDTSDSYYYADAYDDQIYEGGEDRFFNATDEELEQWSRGVARQDRKRRSVGLKILVAFILVVVLAFGAAIVLYLQGYGYPTQETVVSQLFADPQAAKTSLFASNMSDDDITAALEIVPEGATVAVDGVDRSAASSTVYATVTTAAGGETQYKIALVRDAIGWKIAGIELYFASQN